MVVFSKAEIVQIAETVSKEKNIDKASVIEVIKESIQRTAKVKFGLDSEIVVNIDSKTGNMELIRLRKVVEKPENYNTEISLQEAQRVNPELQLDDMYQELLPSFEFSRINTQSSKQWIMQKIRELVKTRQYDEYKNRIGEIVNGLIKQIEGNNLIIDLGNAEAILRKDQLIPREMFKVGDRVRSYIYDVNKDSGSAPQITLSRTHPQFLASLFEFEVPEIYDGLIQIKSVARDPGSRAKIAVYAEDPNIDAVGACVGVRGNRVQTIVNELFGEKIDIVNWSEDVAKYVINALQPAKISKVILDSDIKRVEVVLPSDQLSLAIGRRGQNVSLASQLIGWEIDLLSEEEEAQRSKVELTEKMELFTQALDVDDIIAQLLVTEGFSDVEEIALSPIQELNAIPGFDEGLSSELKTRAITYLEKIKQDEINAIKELGVNDDLLSFKGLTNAMILKLAQNNVKSLEDFADLSIFDLLGGYEKVKGEKNYVQGIFSHLTGINKAAINNLIIEARKTLGWIKD